MPLRTGRRDWLWGITLGIIGLVVVVGGFLALTGGGESVETHAEIDGVKCQSKERLDYHVHAHMSILVEGEQLPVPANIGVLENCLFWLHTHTDDGLLHIEAPEEQDFTLGQFFAVWGQPLSSTQLLDDTVEEGQEMQVTVDGETVSGDPADIILGDQQTIVIQLGPPFGTPSDSPFDPVD
jgi:hypothetical protein